MDYNLIVISIFMLNISLFYLLYAIQNIRTPMLDKIFVTISSIPGDYGQMWVVLGVLLLLFKKTRKCGLVMIASYLLVYGVGQYVLKDLIARPRPCHIDETIELLVKRPSSYSCPSTRSVKSYNTCEHINCGYKSCRNNYTMDYLQ